MILSLLKVLGPYLIIDRFSLRNFQVYKKIISFFLLIALFNIDLISELITNGFSFPLLENLTLYKNFVLSLLFLFFVLKGQNNNLQDKGLVLLIFFVLNALGNITLLFSLFTVFYLTFLLILKTKLTHRLIYSIEFLLFLLIFCLMYDSKLVLGETVFTASFLTYILFSFYLSTLFFLFNNPFKGAFQQLSSSFVKILILLNVSYFLKEKNLIDLNLFMVLSSIMIFISFAVSLLLSFKRVEYGSLNLILSNSLLYLYIVYGLENHFFLASLLTLLSVWIYHLIRSHDSVLYELYGSIVIMLFVFIMFFNYHVNIDGISIKSDVFNLLYFFSAVFHSLLFFSNFRSVGKYGRHV